jgi:lipopolysaccharide export system protein LptA
MRRRLFPALAVLSLACAARAAAPEAPKPKPPAQHQQFEHLDVWASLINYFGKDKKFVFDENVTVIKGNMRIDCDRMDGFIDAKTRQITTVTATGDVKMLSVSAVKMGPDGKPMTEAPSDAWRASCGRADYDFKTGDIILRSVPGKPRPKLWRGKGYGEADTIKFFPDQGEYELIGNPVIRGIIPTGPATGPKGGPTKLTP